MDQRHAEIITERTVLRLPVAADVPAIVAFHARNAAHLAPYVPLPAPGSLTEAYWQARSGRVLRRLGFVVEGYARDYLLIAGEWRDHVLTSLTNADWQP